MNYIKGCPQRCSQRRSKIETCVFYSWKKMREITKMQCPKFYAWKYCSFVVVFHIIFWRTRKMDLHQDKLMYVRFVAMIWKTKQPEYLTLTSEYRFRTVDFCLEHKSIKRPVTLVFCLLVGLSWICKSCFPFLHICLEWFCFPEWLRPKNQKSGFTSCCSECTEKQNVMILVPSLHWKLASEVTNWRWSRMRRVKLKTPPPLSTRDATGVPSCFRVERRASRVGETRETRSDASCMKDRPRNKKLERIGAHFCFCFSLPFWCHGTVHLSNDSCCQHRTGVGP